MAKILISGMINIETTLRVDDGFPVMYQPVRYPFFGVNSTVCGVGYNLAKALVTLGNEVQFLSLIGNDDPGELVLRKCADEGIPSDDILRALDVTPQAVILYDADGRRMIFTDLKDVQEQVYPVERFDAAAEGAELAALCNINFSRPLLERAKARELRIATDVHTIADIHDEYNRDFMAAADVLFMSHEKLPVKPEAWVHQLMDKYGVSIIGIGLGAEGVLLAVRNDGFIERIPAVKTRPIINTIGAGDALFSSFLHGYVNTGDPYESIRKAVTFASYKIGEKGAAEGFLDAVSLEELHKKRPRIV